MRVTNLQRKQKETSVGALLQKSKRLGGKRNTSAGRPGTHRAAIHSYLTLGSTSPSADAECRPFPEKLHLYNFKRTLVVGSRQGARGSSSPPRPAAEGSRGHSDSRPHGRRFRVPGPSAHRARRLRLWRRRALP